MEEKTNEIKNLVIFIIVVIIVFVLFYMLTVLITKSKKSETTKQQDVESAIQYDEIIVGNIFKQIEDEYYVVAIASDDSSSSSYTSLIQEYVAIDNSLKVYTIDLKNGFNKNYVSENSSFEGIPVFKESTLLKINTKKIISIYEGKDTVTRQLQLIIDEIKE